MRAQTARKIGWNRTDNAWNWGENGNETVFQAEELMIHPRQNRTKAVRPPNSFSKVNYFFYNNFFTPWDQTGFAKQTSSLLKKLRQEWHIQRSCRCLTSKHSDDQVFAAAKWNVWPNIAASLSSHLILSLTFIMAISLWYTPKMGIVWHGMT